MSAIQVVIPSNLNTIKTSDKIEESFRVYTTDEDTPARVIEHYRDMRINHTVDFYKRMEKKYTFENGGRRLMTIEEAFTELENYVDASDPDLDFFLTISESLWSSKKLF